jgi:hypothetical protein
MFQLSNAANEFSQDTEPVEMALVMVFRHMGNGVDRVEMARMVPAEEVVPEMAVPGRLRVEFRPGTLLADLSGACFKSLGFPARTPHQIQDGFVRALGDDLVELSTWLVDH